MSDKVKYYLFKKNKRYSVLGEAGPYIMTQDSNGAKRNIPRDKVQAWIGANKAYLSMDGIRDDTKLD